MTPLPSRFRHTVHAYQAIPAWNAAGTHLLYLAFDEPGRDGAIVVQELASGAETVLGTTNHANCHTAACQRWCLDDTAVVYVVRDETSGELYQEVVRLAAPGQPQRLHTLPGRHLRHILRDSRYASAQAYPAGETNGWVERVDLLTGQAETIVQAADVLPTLPVDPAEQTGHLYWYPLEHLEDYCMAGRVLPPAGGYCFQHALFNPAEDRLFFKFDHYLAGRGAWLTCHVFNLHSRRLVCLGDWISGHPLWLPDGRSVVNIMRPDDTSTNRWLVAQDAETGAVRRLLDLPIEGPGHPAPSPDGRWLLTDAFATDGQCSPLYLVELATGHAREIARLPHRFAADPPTSIRRSQPHPTWSPCGRRAAVNCNSGGERLQILLVDDFLEE